ACAEMALRRIVVPPALPAAWRPGDVQLSEDAGLSAGELDAVDGAVTGCAVAIAETGTIVLDGSPVCGRRLLTLVPDHHIYIILTKQIIKLVPKTIATVAPAMHKDRRPITLVSRPS